MKITKKNLITVSLSSLLFLCLFVYSDLFDRYSNFVYYLSALLVLIDYLLITYPWTKNKLYRFPLDILFIGMEYIIITFILFVIVYFTINKIFPCFNIGPTPYGCIFKTK